MQIHISQATQFTISQDHSDVPEFTSPPIIVPATGPAGTRFDLYSGCARNAVSLKGRLTLDGVDVTADVTQAGGLRRYQSERAGQLVWEIAAENELGTTQVTGAALVQTADTTTPEAPAPQAPAPFGAATWGLTDAATATGTELDLTILSLPDDGGQPIVSIEYRVDSGDGFGAATALQGSVTGSYRIAVGAGTPATVEIRALNATGPAPWSIGKQAIPTAIQEPNAGTMEIVLAGETFALADPQAVVTHADGPVQIVSDQPVQITLPLDGRSSFTSPGGSNTFEDVVIRRGTRNLTFKGDQGFDARMGYSAYPPFYNEAVSETGTITLNPGDILVWAKSRPEHIEMKPGDQRDGLALAYPTIYVHPTPAEAGSLAPQVVRPAGDTSVSLEAAPDWDALVASLPTWTIASAHRPAAADIIAGLQFNALAAFTINATPTAGYEESWPYRFGGADHGQYAGMSNYGQSTMKRMDDALAALHDDAFTADERKAILVGLASFGKQLYQGLTDAGVALPEDGGHFQPFNPAIQFYLWATGQTGALDGLWNAFGGNYKQAILIDQALLDAVQPFGDPDNLADWDTHPDRPWYAHKRRVLAVNGDDLTLRVEVGSGNSGDSSKTVFRGLMLTDGTESHLITSGGGGTMSTGDKSLTVPGHTFRAGDVVWMESEYALIPGEPEWNIRSLESRPYYFLPTAQAAYRSIVGWHGSFMALHARDEMRPDYAAAAAYVAKAALPDTPTAANDWPKAYVEGSLMGDWIAQHGNEVMARSQTVTEGTGIGEPGTTPTHALMLNSATTPGVATPGPLIDGVIVGAKFGASTAAVRLRGQATEGAHFTAKIRRRSDDSVVATVTGTGGAGNAFDLTADLPRADDWWLVDLSYDDDASDTLGLAATNPARWAVGYKFLLLGQSQMTIFFGSTAYPYASEAGARLASVYQWQEWNASGNSPTAEEITVLDGTSGGDGPRSFADQWAAFDGTPIQIVRQSVNGRGIIELTDDSNDGQRWSDLTNKTDKYGADFTAIASSWISNNYSPLQSDRAGVIKILKDIRDQDGGTLGMWETGHMPTLGYTKDHDLTELSDVGLDVRDIPWVVVPGTRDSRTSAIALSAAEVSYANLVNAGGSAHDKDDYAIALPVTDYEIEEAGGPHPDSSTPANVRFGQAMAFGFARAAGLDDTQNPSISTVARSMDGTYLDVSFRLPNGGSLASPDVSKFAWARISEDGGDSFSSGPAPADHGYVPSIVGNKLRLAKTSGTWASAPSLRVRWDENGPWRDNNDGATEAAIVEGHLYETHPNTVAGLGLPINGYWDGTAWELDAPELTPTQASTETVEDAVLPDAFAAGDWSAVTGAAARQIALNITALPADGGATITAIEYDVDGSDTWASLGGAGTGAYALAMPAGSTPYAIRLRAVNSVGAGPASAGKSATSAVGATVPAPATAPALLSYREQLDMSGDLGHRVTFLYHAFRDTGAPRDGAVETDPGGTAPAEGDIFVTAVSHAQAISGTTYPSGDNSGSQVYFADGSKQTLTPGGISSTSPGGKRRETFLVPFQQGAGTPAEDWRTQGSAGSSTARNMRTIGVFKMPAGHTLTGMVQGNGAGGSITLDLSGVPGTWALVAVAQDVQDGSAITFGGGLTLAHEKAGTFDGTPSRQAVATGTASGKVTLTATGAEQFSVIALPPA